MVIKHLEFLEPEFGVNPSFLALVNILILSSVSPRLMAAEWHVLPTHSREQIRTIEPMEYPACDHPLIQ